MRYAIYALLVLAGIGGLLFGLSVLADPRTELQGIFFMLIGVTSIGALGVVMAIEHASAAQLVELRELRRLAVQGEKRAQAYDQRDAEKAA